MSTIWSKWLFKSILDNCWHWSFDVHFNRYLMEFVALCRNTSDAVCASGIEWVIWIQSSRSWKAINFPCWWFLGFVPFSVKLKIYTSLNLFWEYFPSVSQDTKDLNSPNKNEYIRCNFEKEIGGKGDSKDGKYLHAVLDICIVHKTYVILRLFNQPWLCKIPNSDALFLRDSKLKQVTTIWPDTLLEHDRATQTIILVELFITMILIFIVIAALLQGNISLLQDIQWNTLRI